jgi:hypothetical protein
VFPNVFIAQSTRCLDRFGFEHLVRAANAIRHVAIAMQVASALPTGSSLKLGAACENAYIQFAAAYCSVFWKRANPPLAQEDQELLELLLAKVSCNAERWMQWMLVFNRYPTRAGPMQNALGRTLARTSDSAVTAYIDAMILNPAAGDGRDVVAECLRTFAESASEEHRQYLWKRAHDRWEKWRFGIADYHPHMFAIGNCELDYAIVGYALECMTEHERNEAIAGISRQLASLQNVWHGSHSDCIAEWNRLLSQLQPYAHADEVLKSGQDWLMRERQYMPFKPDENQYATMMYGIGQA